MNQFELAYMVDDDDVVLMMATKIFARQDKFERLQTFGQGKLALATLADQVQRGKGLPSVILLDLNMPGMDGWEFLEELKDIPQTSHVPVVIMTSSIDPQDVARSKTFGNVKDYISKPLTAEKLEQIHARIGQ